MNLFRGGLLTNLRKADWVDFLNTINIKLNQPMKNIKIASKIAAIFNLFLNERKLLSKYFYKLTVNTYD